VPVAAGSPIDIDGKSLRGSHNGCEAMTHLVSAWDSAAGVTLRQFETVGKSNEIAAIQQLVTLLAVRGATVTIDAMMSCQREIVEQFIEQGADYIIAVTNNQPTLARAMESAFQDEPQGLRRGRPHQDTDTTKDQGRLEMRRCVAAPNLSTLLGKTS
jgi:predicted transposase YbfD/YdcC